MESSTNGDYLNFKKNDNLIKSIIGVEELILSTKIIKINSIGASQERNFIITNQSIYYVLRKK